ncbi:rh71 [macacine betaherpesvirus 3]|uniref:Rh71 n=1 Tax=Rhesus cytomegalovirus (strain 68-1) TaxID=47929 RepID=Q7TFR0_RHCM6|nr:rh71 [macacine betaherpesvirus 3]AAP50598.1 rh71 [macacine betaherpesvirus 3]AAZ80569.1 rh71 [macacine betaherpesvirus 3]
MTRNVHHRIMLSDDSHRARQLGHRTVHERLVEVLELHVNAHVFYTMKTDARISREFQLTTAVENEFDSRGSRMYQNLNRTGGTRGLFEIALDPCVGGNPLNELADHTVVQIHMHGRVVALAHQILAVYARRAKLHVKVGRAHVYFCGQVRDVLHIELG